ncbi:asparagine synthase-related protein [Piscinibacter sakaiensis]|uniref:asparagine synthase-related protein n=1 Tax=Piscinibacter sakaiensis TaxID=1547922 RepID=UPI003AAC5EA1
MFRYLCLAWDALDTSRTLRAQHLGRAVQSRSGWRCVLRQPGLQVFVVGDKPGTNETYHLHKDEGLIVGKLFRRSGSLQIPRTLEISGNEAVEILRRQGMPLIDRYWGRYVAIWRGGPDGVVSVLRDPSGTLPCHFLQHEGVWIIFSWMEDVMELLPTPHQPKPDVEGVRAFLLLGALSGGRTALSDVGQVLPGERLDIRRNTVCRQPLWSAIDFAASASTLRGAEAADALRDTVQRCVRQWATAYDRIVLRLSGGVDSSILASCLAERDTEVDVLCLNYHSTDPGADERRYARLAARMAQRPLREVKAEVGIRLERLLHLPRTPAPRSHVGALSMTRIDAAVAAEFGASAMYSGVGGDLLFFELHRWWPAADYLRIRGMDRGFPAATLDAAQLGSVSVWYALAMAMRERLRPTRAIVEPGLGHTLLAPDAMAFPDRSAAFQHPAFHSPTRLPIGKLQQLQQLMYPVDYYEPLAFETAPEPVRPLLSQPLLELALKIPTYVLTEGGRGRALARSAFSAVLPPEIASRRTKGSTGQSVKDILVENLDFARSLLADGELVRLGLVDRKRTLEALSNGPKALATPFGEVNALISVEAWLRCWSQPTSRPAKHEAVIE